MNKQERNGKSLLGMVAHVMSFGISELCKYGYLLAFEKELFDLKGLVAADSMNENDFEILEGLDDPAVQLLLKSITKLAKHMKIYTLINSLDEMEVMTDRESHQLASNSFHAYITEGVGNDYEALIFETHELYFAVMHLLYHTACQLEAAEVDLPESIFDTFYFDFLDVLDGNKFTDDKNVQLLYDLIVDLNKDADEFSLLT